MNDLESESETKNMKLTKGFKLVQKSTKSRTILESDLSHQTNSDNLKEDLFTAVRRFLNSYQQKSLDRDLR